MPGRVLGCDPSVGQFRPGNFETATRIVDEGGVADVRRVDKASTRPGAGGRTDVAVGDSPAKYFERRWPDLHGQILRHLRKWTCCPWTLLDGRRRSGIWSRSC